jgi:hypothetical protein
MKMEKLTALSSLLRQRNSIDGQIAKLVGRPAHSGHIGEFIASTVFDIELHPTAVHKASDGIFRSGPLKGKNVNVKYGSRWDGLLNMIASDELSNHPDVYLVMTGPTVGAISSRGLSAPWSIANVLVFDPAELLLMLANKNRKPGTATSIPTGIWQKSLIYPVANNQRYILTEQQREMLALFAETD